MSLTGTTVTLAGITFNSSNGFTISSGTIILQGAATPIVVSTGTGTITAVMTGNGVGVNKSGAGTLVLGAVNTYTGSTTISNGAIQTTVAGALPATTFLTLGDNSNDSGVLILGAGQSLAGLATIGAGTSNSIVGGTTTVSTLTLSTGTVASAINTFTGNLGGGGANQNNLALTVTGAATQILSGSITYTGPTIISGGVLQTSNLLPNTSSLTLNGGVWQPVLSANSVYNLPSGATWTLGGFAATNGFTLGVTVDGGAMLVYGGGGATNIGSIGVQPLTFGSNTANGTVNLTNPINLSATDGIEQIFIVNGTNSVVNLSGVLSQPAAAGAFVGLTKQGTGTLILSALNTYSSLTIVAQGTLITGTNSVGTTSAALGIGTGPNGAPTAPSAVALGNGATTVGSNPTLLIGGAFGIDRNITVTNSSSGNAYAIGGSTNSSGTFSGIITSASPGRKYQHL